MAYCDINQNMDIIEEFMSNVIKDTLENCPDELKILERDVSKLENISAPFPRISYDEAVDILTKKGHEFEYGSDFGAPDEEVLSFTI